MAGESILAAGFPAEEFRTNIQQVMLMGMPDDPADRLTFHWDRQRTYDPATVDDDPLDWTETPDTDIPGDWDHEAGTYQPIYALEFSARPAGSTNTPLGEIDTSRLIITLLDVDYEQVKTADYATIKDVRYRIQFAAPEVAMFPVGVHQVYMEAEDQA